MNATRKQFLIKTIQIRMNNGETLEEILDSWPKLTADERAELEAEFTTEESE